MALSPSIPTSFVPRQPVSTDKRRFSSGGNNVFLIAAAIILAVTIAAAGAEFFYAQFLAKEENAKAAQIIAAQKNVSEDTVNQFIRLHDRFVASKSVINEHVALTQFFNLLETITIQTVHFDGVNMKVNDDRSAQISMTGEAKDFNSLAAQSTVFANQKYIKNAIFSGFAINKDNSVSFTVTASLDPAVVIEKVPTSQQAVPVFGPVPATPVVPTVPVTAPAPAAPTSTTTASSTKP